MAMARAELCGARLTWWRWSTSTGRRRSAQTSPPRSRAPGATSPIATSRRRPTCWSAGVWSTRPEWPWPGGSYGGYLVAFITGQTNRYSCAVAHAAVTNLGGMYASDITAGRALAYGAEIFEDRARVERYSPSSHAAGYDTPTLVIHGERDYRVPLTQGLELYGVLKAKEVPARLVYYPSENHWILNPQPSLHWYEEVFTWLDVYLR